MRHAFRALSLLLVFLLATSAPAMAFSPEMLPTEGLIPGGMSEGFLGSAFEIAIDNVKVGVMDAEPAAIGLSARTLFGADGARYMAAGELSGVIGKAFAYALCFEDGAYRVRMQNLSSDYTLSEAALDALDPSERPIDFPLVPPVQPKDVLAVLTASQRQSAAQGANFFKAPSYEPAAFRKLGYDHADGAKRVNVLGENLELMFYEAELDAAAMDAWDAALRDATPEANAAQAEIDAIINKYSSAQLSFAQQTPQWEQLPEPTPSPEPEPEQPGQPSPDGYVKRGEHVEAKIRLWSDETASNTRSEKEVLVASGAGDKRAENHTSTVWEQHVDENSCVSQTRRITTDRRRRSVYDERTEYRDDGGVMRFNLETETVSHYEDGDYRSDTRDQTAIGYTVEPDGTHEMRIGGYTMPYGGQKIEVLFEAEGGPEGDDGAVVSHMTFSAKLNEQKEQDGEERQVFALSGSFDMHMRVSPLPEGPLAPLLGLDDGAASLDLGKLSADQKQALEAEMSTAMIIGSGSMMATPGVAKLIADVQSAMTRMMQDMFDQYAQEDIESAL